MDSNAHRVGWKVADGGTTTPKPTAGPGGWEALLDPFGLARAVRDPFDLVQRWYEAVGGPLTEMANDVLEQEAFLRSAKRLIGYSAALDKAVRTSSERYFSGLSLATAPDVDRIATLIVNLDDKVDRLEDELDRLIAAMEKATTNGDGAR
jgi:hypothetical protein